MKFQFELKERPPVSDSELAELTAGLKEAQKKAAENFVTITLEKGEEKAEVRKKLQYVAEKAGISLRITSPRNEKFLRLTFPATKEKKTRATRMSAEETRRQILEVLQKADKPISRADVLDMTDVSGASWNARIKELVDEGVVKKIGNKKNTTYELK